MRPLAARLAGLPMGRRPWLWRILCVLPSQASLYGDITLLWVVMPGGRRGRHALCKRLRVHTADTIHLVFASSSAWANRSIFRDAMHRWTAWEQKRDPVRAKQPELAEWHGRGKANSQGDKLAIVRWTHPQPCSPALAPSVQNRAPAGTEGTGRGPELDSRCANRNHLRAGSAGEFNVSRRS